MRLRNLYAILAAVGFVLPLWVFVPFLREHGFDPRLFVLQLFASPVSGFFGMDVIVSAIVLALFVMTEGRRMRMRALWLPIVGTVVVGVSFGLPLFLFMRETASGSIGTYDADSGSLSQRRGAIR